jgi:hypothetical protein
MCECLLVDGGHVIVTPGGKKALMAAWTSEQAKRCGPHHRWRTTSYRTARRSCCATPVTGRSSTARRYGFGVDADTGELLWSVP